MRHWILEETNYGHVRDNRYDVAVLPLGATEPHNLHLPYGTDIFEASQIAAHAAEANHPEFHTNAPHHTNRSAVCCGRSDIVCRFDSTFNSFTEFSWIMHNPLRVEPRSCLNCLARKWCTDAYPGRSRGHRSLGANR